METLKSYPNPRLGLRLCLDTSRVERSTLLLVEDDEALRRGLNRILVALGYQVREASRLEEAKAACLIGGLPALVLSDYHLPDGTGLDLLDWLIQDVHAEPPFVLMSGEYLSTLNLVGDFLFLQKPFSGEQLKKLLDQTCAQHASRGGLSGHAC
jgi:DNA-binding NtrC family response regulator